ncbi:DUF58 domain-containing protein [Christensenellaceae bacterium OttesenSCG-928-M15]|nr:DUF58 domain-containing protein [Christensenellaceae bacterium OttesenSCG-928-M15]
MLKNRVMLLVTALLLVLFYIFYLDYFSYYLLFYALFVLAASLALFLLGAFFVRYEITLHDGSAKRAEPFYFDFYAENRLRLPVVGVCADMEFLNLFTGEKGKDQVRCLPGFKKSVTRVKQQSAHCGMVRCTLKKVKTFDLLGIFAFRRHAGQTAQMLVLPDTMLLNSEVELENPNAAQKKTASGGNPYGGYEIRGYRPGDSLRNIHWKLSAKLNDYFVKEFNDTAPGSTRLLMGYCETLEGMDNTVAFFLAFAAQMVEMRHVFSAVYLDGEKNTKEYPIETSDDIYGFLCAFLSIPYQNAPADPFTAYYDRQNMRLFRAREDGLYDVDREWLIEGLYV